MPQSSASSASESPARPLRVLLGISGGIAAYKSAELVRRLNERSAEVRVVMTRAAQAFITPLTLQALSGQPVRTDLLSPEAEAGMDHIALARWADQVLIAPATADLIARLACGLADDLLTTLVLATAGTGGDRAGDESADVGASCDAGECAAPIRARGASSAQPLASRPVASRALAAWWSLSSAMGPRRGAARFGRSGLDARRATGADDRRTDARGDRPGALHWQSQLWQDGLCAC